MYLEEISSFSPPKYGYFVNEVTTIFDIHPSTDFISFTTRANEIILRNQRTGRTNILYQSAHPILSLKFTNDHLLAVEQSVNQILVFSLKNDKLKKKLTGHRNQVIKLAYCRQRELFVSISHDTCLIFSETTLNKQKTLKCSTSSFVDCIFAQSGQYLFTAFQDSTLFVWNLDDYSYQQYCIDGKNMKNALNDNTIIASYNDKLLYLADFSKESLKFTPIQKFWSGKLVKVDFIGVIMIVLTTKSLYLAQLDETHRLTLKEIKEIDSQVNEIASGSYGSLALILSQKYRKFSIMKVNYQRKGFTQKIENPLTNQGLYCAGGYSNQEGCFLKEDLKKTNQYYDPNYQIQQISAVNYSQTANTQFSHEKLKEFINKHHILPDRHRPAAYKFLLNLPVSPREFRLLQNKGRHQCTELLQTKYPLKNKKLSEVMKNVLSLLAHYHPIFAEADNIPQIIFPFVCLFGNDEFLCFQILYRLFTNWLSFLFAEFPVANSKYLQNMYQIYQKEEPDIINHLKQTNIPFTKITWGLLSNLFTANVPRQSFLGIIDNIFVRGDEPAYVMFICLGYLSYNKSRIMSMKNIKDLESFLQTEHTVHTPKLINHINRLYQTYKNAVIYQFQSIPMESKGYHQLESIPKDAVKMYEGRRKLLTQELNKLKQEESYKEKMMNQMEKMITKARRDAQRQIIQKQSYDLLCQNEKKTKVQYVQTDKQQRIHKLQRLIDELTTALENQNLKKQAIKSRLPDFSHLQNRTTKQLDDLQLKLMNLLSQLKPSSLQHPMKSQPFALSKNTINDQKVFKASVKSQMTNKLWDIDSLQGTNHGKMWQNNILRAMKVE